MGKVDSVDFKAITAEVVKEVSSIPLERPGGFFSRHPVRADVSPEILREMLLRKVWGKGIELLNSLEARAEPLVAEKALSVLMKKGVVREKIIYRKNSFRLKLENSQYRAYTSGASGPVYACPWPSEKRYEIVMSAGRFADFLLQFDAGIPEIVSHIPEIVETLRSRELEERKRKTERELKDRVLQSLIGQYLKPLGLSVRYELEKDDRVSVDVSQTLSAHLEMPFAQVTERLQDADAIKTLLRPGEDPGAITDMEEDGGSHLII